MRERRSQSSLGAMCAAIILVLGRGGDADQELQIAMPDGSTRRALLHLPASGGPLPRPVILGFHGGTGNAESFRALTGLNGTANARGFAVAYLDAGDGVWGDYRASTGSPENDLAYVRATIDRLTHEFGVDPRRVYATGLSNGAGFAFVLGAELRDRVTAIAPVAHNLARAFIEQATPDGPVHVLQIVGTADPLIAFEGGVFPGTGEPSSSSLEAMTYWQAVNGNGPPSSAPLANPQADGTISFLETYTPSEQGFELARIVVVNGGHTWPGGLQYLPESAIGLTSRDFSASEVIWNFFARKVLPGPGCEGDVDGDGSAGLSDLARLIVNWGLASPPASTAEDLDSSGDVGLGDIAEVIAHWGESCGGAALSE